MKRRSNRRWEPAFPASRRTRWQALPLRWTTINRMVTILSTLVAVTIALPLVASAHTPAGAAIPIPGTPVLISGGSGNQTDPHISGTLVSYTNVDRVELTSQIRYHDLTTGADAAIPAGSHRDSLSDVRGKTVVFRRVPTDGTTTTRPIMLFDTSNPAEEPVELDPVPGIRRGFPAIGGRTVAWMEFPSTTSNSSDIVAYDLETRHAVPLTTDGASISNLYPAVSPDGIIVTWNKCDYYAIGGNCRIFAARRSADGTWTTIELNNSDGEDFDPDTNGQVVVYTSNAGGDFDIFWENPDGTDERQLPMPDGQYNPSIQGSLIAFENEAAGSTDGDLFVYDLATGMLYQVTNTPTVDESLSDISLAPDGTVWMVWAQPDGLNVGDNDIYAHSFRLPAGDSTPPTITITAPANNTRYTLNQVGAADYTCADEAGGTGVASCVGTVGDNSAIDTASVGTKTFTVNAADNAGNTASKSVSYNVAYKICALYDQSKAYRSNSIVPIKLQLCDAGGANTSSTSIVVHATGLAKKDNTASNAVEDTGNANPDNDFRYDATLGGTGGYIYNLSTRGLTTGTWVLSFTATGDPVTHSVTFDVR